jgi:hypothetical protein
MSDVMSRMLEHIDAARICPGEVVDVTESGTVVLKVEGNDADPIRCDMLVTTDTTPPVLVPGDAVLVWLAAGEASGVVLGRVGPSRGLTPERGAVPDAVTIEAKRSVTIRVGEGSIDIREGGKILIKGTDVVSHAKRTNRIKGGAVAIN